MTDRRDQPANQKEMSMSGEGWRPIETAPRDGSPFLAYLPQASWAPSLKPTITTLYWAPWENFASLYAERLGESEGDCGDWRPTHWMPLPEPPALSLAQGQTDD